jgi:hypothetical protein
MNNIARLQELNANATFRPFDGYFRSKLTKIYADIANEDTYEDFSKRCNDMAVSVSECTTEEGIIRFLVISDQEEHLLECNISDLNEYEFSDFYKQLTLQITNLPVAPVHKKVIIRKKSSAEMLDIRQSAQKLGCSTNFLKSLIPCTDYSYCEINGKTEIKEFYWSRKLIERLSHIKLNGTEANDVKYIADECCDGDSMWAKEIVVSLDMPISASKTERKLPKSMTSIGTKKVISREFMTRKQHPRKNPEGK